MKTLIVLTLFAVATAVGVTIFSFNTPTPTAQVGVPYSSSCTASGGNAPRTYSISAGALPTNLGINTSTGAIAGTPTAAGVFNFTCTVVDTPPPDAASPADANRRVIAKSGTPTATGSSAFTITVAAAASPTPVPPSIWMAAMGLAGAGIFRRRQLKRG